MFFERPSQVLPFGKNLGWASKKATRLSGGGSLSIFSVNLYVSSSSRCEYNNDNHNNNCSNSCDDLIYYTLRHEGLLYCKYTPADLNKQRTIQLF